MSISLYTTESGFSSTSMANTLVPAEILPVRGATRRNPPASPFAWVHRIERFQHGRIVIAHSAVNGEPTRRIARAQDLLPCQLPVHIACQGCQKRDVLHIFFSVQHRLVQMSNAPARGNVEAQAFCQRSGREIAYDLFRKGKRPVIVEAKNDLMAVRGLCLANTSYLRDFFQHQKVPVHLESTVAEIREKDGTVVRVPADSVILSAGYAPAPPSPR